MLKKISLTNFRSFLKKGIAFSSQVTLILGENASGKTNILEGLYLLSRGKSFHARKEEEMVFHKHQWARVEGEFNGLGLEVFLTRSQYQEHRRQIKSFKVNGVKKRWHDFIGGWRLVLFRPEDIEIILGAPSARRDYLDAVLEVVDWQYRGAKLAYDKALKQRNKLLDLIRDGKANRSQLLFWDQLLIKNGTVITNKRRQYIDFLNNYLKKKPSYFSLGSLKIIYDLSSVTPERLVKYSEAEIALGNTLVGPHRDNMQFISADLAGGAERDLGIFGSRGEQRLAVLALKLGELAFIENTTQEKPCLLLDDIFSELDRENRRRVFKIACNYQAVITATDLNSEIKKHDKIKIIEL